MSNEALEALNTQAGQTIIQFTLLTGVLTGFLSIGGTLLKHLVSMATAVKGLSAIAGASGLAGTLGAVASAALPVAAAIAAIVVAGIGLKKLADYLHPSLEEIEDQLQADSTQLEENKKRLEELNSVTYTARTPEIEEEIRALQEANEELEKNSEELIKIAEIEHPEDEEVPGEAKSDDERESQPKISLSEMEYFNRGGRE